MSRGAAIAVDFGAGMGTFATAVRHRGLSVICIEEDASLRGKLRRLGLDAHGSLNALKDQSLDYIFSLNVLEHIQNDEEALKTLYVKLKPSGGLFLFVPAFTTLYSSMDRKVGHYRRYKRDALVKMIQRVGFTTEWALYVDSLGFFVTLIYKLIGNRQGDISPAALKIYDRFLFPISRLLDRMGMAYWFGKNLMLMVRRPPAP